MEKAGGYVAAPTNSTLLKFKHQTDADDFTPDQRTLVTQWLTLEANARNLVGAVPKPKSIKDAYKKFANCMNFDVWMYYRMGDLPFTQTDADGPCMGCHSRGQASTWLSATASETFGKAKQFPYIQKFVVGKLDDSGSFESLQPSKRFESKANEDCPADATDCHPRFGLPPNIAAAIDGFVNTTIQNLATNTCNNGIVVPKGDGGAPDAGDGGAQ
jgi:hypothetical protein